MGKPQEDPEDYDVSEVDGIRVHVRVDVQTEEEGLRIRHSKFMFKENIIVEGIVY